MHEYDTSKPSKLNLTFAGYIKYIVFKIVYYTHNLYIFYTMHSQNVSRYTYDMN